MATKILSAHRHLGWVADDADEGSYSSGYMDTKPAIVVRVDLYSDGRHVAEFLLTEAAFPGIVAEWTTGTATTIIEAAVATKLAAFTLADTLTSAQRTNLVAKVIAWP